MGVAASWRLGEKFEMRRHVRAGSGAALGSRCSPALCPGVLFYREPGQAATIPWGSITYFLAAPLSKSW